MKKIVLYLAVFLIALETAHLFWPKVPHLAPSVRWNQDAGYEFGKYTCPDGQVVEMLVHENTDNGAVFAEGVEFQTMAQAKSKVERTLPLRCF